jgi:hypothetical protein
MRGDSTRFRLHAGVRTLPSLTSRSLYNAVVAVGLVVIATAASAEEGAWYAGMMADSSSVSVLHGANLYVAPWESGPGSSGYTLRGGRRVNKHIAVELGFRQTANLEWTEPFATVSGLPGVYESEVSFDATVQQLSVLGVWPFARVWEAYVKGGFASYRFTGTQTLTDVLGGAAPLSRSVSTSSHNYGFGFGVGATFKQNWHASMEVSSFNIDESFVGATGAHAALDTWSVGLEYRFGRRSERP